MILQIIRSSASLTLGFLFSVCMEGINTLKNKWEKSADRAHRSFYSVMLKHPTDNPEQPWLLGGSGIIWGSTQYILVLTWIKNSPHFHKHVHDKTLEWVFRPKSDITQPNSQTFQADWNVYTSLLCPWVSGSETAHSLGLVSSTLENLMCCSYFFFTTNPTRRSGFSSHLLTQGDILLAPGTQVILIAQHRPKQTIKWWSLHSRSPSWDRVAYSSETDEPSESPKPNLSFGKTTSKCEVTLLSAKTHPELLEIRHPRGEIIHPSFIRLCHLFIINGDENKMKVNNRCTGSRGLTSYSYNHPSEHL